jgi:tRNA1Val (adenine37-N6)-methyltransferase
MEERLNLVEPGERLDDLQTHGIKILQKLKGFRFGTDAVLLSHFARARSRDRILDMGCGTGAIALMMAARLPQARITGLEIQPDMADMARRSVALNGLSDRVSVVCGDLRNARELLGRCAFDGVVMNPPYTRMGGGPVSQMDTRALSRHQLTCTLEDMADAAYGVLRNGGRLSVVYPAEGIYELMDACVKCKMMPKKLRMVQHTADRAPKLLLMEAVREGRRGVEWLAPLVLCRQDGSYTSEAYQIYYGRAEEE